MSSFALQTLRVHYDNLGLRKQLFAVLRASELLHSQHVVAHVHLLRCMFLLFTVMFSLVDTNACSVHALQASVSST